MHDIVLVGAGRIGRIHARNAALNPRIRLAGIVDPVAAAAQSLAREWNAPVLELDAALADPNVAGVIIASSTDTGRIYGDKGNAVALSGGAARVSPPTVKISRLVALVSRARPRITRATVWRSMR